MQMMNQLKDSLKTLEEERYLGKITRHDHFDDLTDIDNALNKVPEHLAVEERRRYTESCFGHLLQMDRGMKFSAGIVHRLLIRELHHDGPEDEMRFLLGRHSVRFSKVEFCLITGLKFRELPDTSTYNMVENGINQRYFEGRDEVEYVELKAVLWIGVFSEQYDAVKLCLLYMLNWILMGLDEREKVPGGSLYDVDVGDIHVPVSDPERYTTAGTSDTEGPSFKPNDTEGFDSDGRHIRSVRTRWVRFTLPREPRTRDDSRTGDDSRGGVGGQAEDRRYTELMDVLRELQEEVRKSNEKRDQQHQELLDLIRRLQGSTSHARTRGTRFDDPPFDDKDRHRDFSPRGRTGSHQGDQQGPGVTSLEEVTRGTSGTDTTSMEIEQEPQQVLPDQPVHSQDLVQSTSLQHTLPIDPGVEYPFIHSIGTEIPSLSAPKELTLTDRHRDFSPRGRTGSHQGDQQGPGVTSLEEVTRGTSGIDTTPMEIEQKPQQVLPDQPVHSQDLVQSTSLQHTLPVDPGAEYPFIHSIGTEIPSLSASNELTPAGDRQRYSSYLQRTPTGDIEGQSPSTHHTSGGNTRGQSSSLQLTHLVDHTELDRIPPPLQRQDRVRRPGWQQRTPYTDPSRPKKPKIRPQPPHVWAPHVLIDPDHLTAYQAYKRNSTGELRDVDLLEPVGVPWFHRFQTNIMELEDTHMDAYLHILRKRQRYYSTVYGPRINILDSQFYVLIPCNLGLTHWALAIVDLMTESIYLMDPFRQEVPFRHRKMQLACL
ncbi:hypothetical protein LWI28_003243 [Acer negundo]|uniref:DUF1985 domain-containing protein n=1 Tax=Acer negundo TaxID=4023 RepID=A0AAD5NJH4_ACENE|nr:hypothetical protein LWI28_003243 [Acer negundo]